MANIDGVEVGAGSVSQAFGLLLVGTVVYLATYSICVVVAFWVRKQVVVVVFGVLVGFFGSFLTSQLDKVAALSWLGKLLPTHPNHVALGLDAGIGQVAGTLGVAFGWLVLAALIGGLWLRRADIK